MKKKYLVGFVERIGEDARRLIEQYGGEIEYEFQLLPDVMVADLSEEAVKELLYHPTIRYIEEDKEILDAEPMAQSTSEWGLAATQVKNFWDAGYKGQGVIVSVHDSGCNPHEDLQGAIIASYNARKPDSSDTSDEADGTGHGTSSHGIIGARDNNLGFIGFAPECRMYNVKHSAGGTNITSIVRGIEWAMSRNPRPDIMCLNVQLRNGNDLLHNAIKAAHNAGILIVAAAGNWAVDSNWPGDMAYPGRYPETLAVGAVTSRLVRADYSNIGPNLDIVCSTNMKAPAKDGVSYATFTGTSCAAPAAAGILAVLKSAYPIYSNTQLRAKLYEGLQDLGPTGFDHEYGHGFTRLLSSMLPHSSAPTVPSFTVGSPTDSSLTLTYSATRATSYDIYRNGEKIVSGRTSTSYTDMGLAAKTGYTYYVVARNNYGTSISVEKVGTTLAPPLAPVTILEDFEDSRFELPFTGDWSRTTETEASGEFSYKSKLINHNQTSQTQFTYTIPSNAVDPKLIFDYRTRTEQDYDVLEVLVDGVVKLTASGEKAWVLNHTIPLKTGKQTIVFRYRKDDRFHRSQDTVYIDNVRLTWME